MPAIAATAAAAFSEFIATATAGTALASAGVAVANGALALAGSLGVGSMISAWGTVASFASLAMTPKISASSPGGQISLKLDPTAPAPIALGKTAAAGTIIYRATFGTTNRFLGIVTALSIAGPIQSIEGFYVNGTLIGFSGSPPKATDAFYGDGTGYLWQYSRLGASTDTAYMLTAADWDSQTLPGITSAHKNTGIATLLNIYRWKGDAKNPRFPSGVPKQYVVIKGVKAYDPRLDSTYPGGSGTQRLATPSTWAWTENPYILALNWLLGWQQNSKRVAGVGVPWAAIDVAAFVSGANVADTNSWKCGGLVTTADDKWEALAAILQAGGGLPVGPGAMVSCLVKTSRTSTFTLTAADVIGDVEVTNTLPRRARFNRVIPQYRSETHDWQVVAGAAISGAAFLTADGGEIRTREVNLPLVQNATQAAQLAYYDLADTREGLVMTLPCGPRLLNARVGDCCTVQLPEIGYASQKMIIIGREHDPASLQVTLTLRSETDAKHATALAQTGGAPPTPSLTFNNPTTMAAPAAGDWAISGTTISNGTDAIPAIVITGACTNAMAAQVLFEYKKTADSVWIPLDLKLPDVTRVEIIGVAGSTSYDVRSSYVNGWGYYSTATTEGSVTTGAATVTPPGTYEPPLPPGYTPETPNDTWVSGPNPDVIAF